MWKEVLLALNSTSFGLKDPIFQQDVSFYIFIVPVIKSIIGLCIAIVVLLAIQTFAMYLSSQILDLIVVWNIPKNIKNHFFTLLALFLLLVAAKFYIDRYNILYSNAGIVFGAGYTDIYADLIFL